MNVEYLLYGIFVATVIALGVVLMVVFNVSPSDAGMLGLGALFFSVFCALLGATTLVIYFARRRLKGIASYYDNLGVSIRQAVLVSTALTGLLILQALRVLSIWSGLLYVIAVSSGEIYLRSHAWRVKHR
jgi:hypothetical protein